MTFVNGHYKNYTLHKTSECISVNSTAPAASKKSTDFINNFTNTVDARATNGFFNTFQRVFRGDAVKSSIQDVGVAGITINFSHLFLNKSENRSKAC